MVHNPGGDDCILGGGTTQDTSNQVQFIQGVGSKELEIDWRAPLLVARRHVWRRLRGRSVTWLSSWFPRDEES